MKLLNLVGDKSLLNESGMRLAIVGSRSILSQTKSLLEDLFSEIRNFDITIVSGGMYGVDIYAHNLALESGMKTIVVLPQGIESYNKSSLYSQLKIKKDSKTLFVSEYESNFKPRKYTFIERNKVISDLSRVIFIAQASSRSGSISTANFGIKSKKLVVASPFCNHISQFQGTNLLISRGCTIYLNPETILNCFNICSKLAGPTIINSLKESSKSLSELEFLFGTNSALLQKNLLQLILEGKILFDGEKYFV